MRFLFFFYLICDIGVSFCQVENATSSNLLRGRPRTRSPRRSDGTGGPTAKVVVTRKPNGYEEYGVDSKFKWDIVPWSLPPCRFRTGWSHCELQRRIPIDRITSSREHCLARTPPVLVTRSPPLAFSLPFNGRSWVFHASDELYLRGE